MPALEVLLPCYNGGLAPFLCFLGAVSSTIAVLEPTKYAVFGVRSDVDFV